MKHTICYTADLHGNEIQYRKLMDLARSIKADSIIIGGDIAPKDSSCNYIENQRYFLQKRLPELLEPVKQLPQSKVFLIMGNDDAAINADVLDRDDLYQVIHERRSSLSQNIDIVGYSFVPISPYGIKDWEKFDFTKSPQTHSYNYYMRKSRNYRLDGVVSRRDGWEAFVIDPESEKRDSIQKDLNREIYIENTQNTLYVIHCPPDSTGLDINARGMHEGSMAIRSFIEEKQPYATLHGHIHETVEMSGSYIEKIGKTFCMSSGNHNVGHDLAVLVFDLYDPNSVRRLVI